MPEVIDQQQSSVVEQPVQNGSAAATAPSGTPAPVTNWEAQYAVLQKEHDNLNRSYNGLQGNFKQVKERADGLTLTLDEVTRQHEALKVEAQTSVQAVRSELSEKEKAANEAIAEAASLRERVALEDTIEAEYPELATILAQNPKRRALIREGAKGKSGDALKAFLTDSAEAFKGLGVDPNAAKRDFATGRSPAAPAGNFVANTAATFSEVVTAMNQALKVHGPGSSEYRGLRDQHDSMIKQGLHKPK